MNSNMFLVRVICVDPDGNIDPTDSTESSYYGPYSFSEAHFIAKTICDDLKIEGKDTLTFIRVIDKLPVGEIIDKELKERRRWQ